LTLVEKKLVNKFSDIIYGEPEWTAPEECLTPAEVVESVAEVIESTPLESIVEEVKEIATEQAVEAVTETVEQAVETGEIPEPELQILDTSREEASQQISDIVYGELPAEEQCLTTAEVIEAVEEEVAHDPEVAAVVEEVTQVATEQVVQAVTEAVDQAIVNEEIPAPEPELQILDTGREEASQQIADILYGELPAEDECLTTKQVIEAVEAEVTENPDIAEVVEELETLAAEQTIEAVTDGASKSEQVSQESLAAHAESSTTGGRFSKLYNRLLRKSRV